MLVETMVALSVITIGLLGIFALLSTSMGLNRFVSEKHVATYLAAEGIELVKNLIDTNYIARKGGQLISWNEGLSQAGSYEIDYMSTSLAPVSGGNLNLLYYSDGLYGYDQSGGAEQTKYKREIIIDPSIADQIKVNSIVVWEGRGLAEARMVNLEDKFFDWRP